MAAFMWLCGENSLQWSPMLLLLVGDATQTVVCGCLFCACLFATMIGGLQLLQWCVVMLPELIVHFLGV